VYFKIISVCMQFYHKVDKAFGNYGSFADGAC